MRDRIITALALLAVFVPLYFYIPVEGFVILAVMLGYGMLLESYTMTFGKHKWGPLLAIKPVIILCVFYAFYFGLAFITPKLDYLAFSVISAIFLMIFSPMVVAFSLFWLWIFRVISMLFCKKSLFCPKSLYHCQIFDILIFISSLIVAFYLDKYFLFKMLTLVAGIDTCSYFVGKYFGKRHIVSTISPNKTLEGYIAGLLWTMLFGSIVLIPMELSILRLTLTLGMVYLLAITGDLLVSYQKRLLDVKDSGTLLPGHGGLLDRFDSWMFVSAFVCYLVMIN